MLRQDLAMTSTLQSCERFLRVHRSDALYGKDSENFQVSSDSVDLDQQ